MFNGIDEKKMNGPFTITSVKRSNRSPVKKIYTRWEKLISENREGFTK
jgi:hypothetical protein